MDLGHYIRDVPDFPVNGILFKDITPLLADPCALRSAVDGLVEQYRDAGVELIAAIESRGFLFGAPMAYQLDCGLVPIRKPGKLPHETISVEYSLEYGTNTLEMHRDAIAPGQRVLVVDDLLATGGSARAAIELVERAGGDVVGACFLIELVALGGVAQLSEYDVYSAIQF